MRLLDAAPFWSVRTDRLPGAGVSLGFTGRVLAPFAEGGHVRIQLAAIRGGTAPAAAGADERPGGSTCVNRAAAPGRGVPAAPDRSGAGHSAKGSFSARSQCAPSRAFLALRVIAALGFAS